VDSDSTDNWNEDDNKKLLLAPTPTNLPTEEKAYEDRDKLYSEMSLPSKTMRKTLRVKSKAEPLWNLIKNFFLKLWKLSICSPFVIMILLRVYMKFWILRYNSFLSIIITIWNYYSIWYQNASCFFAVMPYLLIPAISIQLLGTKFVEIPGVMGEVVPDEYRKHLNAIGCLQFASDKNLIPEVEYLITLGGLFLVCATLKMVHYIPAYEEFRKKQALAVYKYPNILEVIVRFFLDHGEKLYIIVLYIISFSVLNVIHTFILLFFILFTLVKSKARRYFPFIIIILAIRSIGRNAVLNGHIIELDYSSNLLRAFTIIGINIDWRDSEKNAVIFKLGTDWELIIMYVCSYIQLRILQYIEKHPFTEMQMNAKSFFVKFASFINYLIQTYLLWGIYFTFILILAYQNQSLFIQGYMIIVFLIIIVHVFKDLNSEGYKGYVFVRPIWNLLAAYNTIILFASYITYFVAYTGDFSIGLSDSTFEMIKILGIEFVDDENKGLEYTFLPQFIILYLGFIARGNILTKRDIEEENEVEYKKSSWMLFIKVVDWFTGYSFQMLFLLFGLLTMLWSMNLSMCVCLIIFCIHYTVLHYKYLDSIKYKDDVSVDYQEKQKIISEECAIQKAKMLAQSKLTLNFLIFLVSISLLATQVFPFAQTYKEYYYSNKL